MRFETHIRRKWYNSCIGHLILKPSNKLPLPSTTQALTNVISALINETNLVHDLFLVYFVNFIYNLYMFRTSPGPSSGGTTVRRMHPADQAAIQNNKYQVSHKYSCMQDAGCILHTRQSAIQNNKYQVSHTYSCMQDAGFILRTRQSAIQNNKYQVSHKYSCMQDAGFILRTRQSAIQNNKYQVSHT